MGRGWWALVLNQLERHGDGGTAAGWRQPGCALARSCNTTFSANRSFPPIADQITMRTTRDAGGPRARWGWWRTVGALGLALALPGGLVLLLYLLARSRTRAVATVRDPYVEWLRTRDRLRSDRPAAGVAVVL